MSPRELRSEDGEAEENNEPSRSGQRHEHQSDHGNQSAEKAYSDPIGQAESRVSVDPGPDASKPPSNRTLFALTEGNVAVEFTLGDHALTV